MRSIVKLNIEQTIAFYGYNVDELTKSSHLKVIVECTNCNKLIHREYRNMNRKHICSSIIGNNKFCTKCVSWKDLSCFNKSCNRKDGVAKICRMCYNSYECVKKADKNKIIRLKNSFENDINYYIKNRISSIKSKCKNSKIEFNIDLEYMLLLWNNQNGKCYYTNIEMKGKGRENQFQSWVSPSIDRLDPNLGYTKNNVVWCIFAVNSFKQSLNELEFKDMINQIKWWCVE